MSTPVLTIGIPSKGRLQENAFAFFRRAGLTIVQPRGSRDYRGTVEGLGAVEIAFLSASEIVGELARGAVHLGVTGADLIHETLADPAEKVAFLAPLGFGHANVVVAVPEAWIDVHDMADIEDVAADFRVKQGRRLRVATKYVNLTRRYFKSLGIADYRIVESLGATEGAPAAGSADIIVDITTTGSTLAANALKVLDGGIMLKSEANLVVARHANWSAEAREVARQVLSRIHAEEQARTLREMRIFRDSGLSEDFRTTLAEQGAEVLHESNDGVIHLMVRAADVASLSDFWLSNGARRVLVGALEYAYSPENRLYEQLISTLPDRAAEAL